MNKLARNLCENTVKKRVRFRLTNIGTNFKSLKLTQLISNVLHDVCWKLETQHIHIPRAKSSFNVLKNRRNYSCKIWGPKITKINLQEQEQHPVRCSTTNLFFFKK